MFINKKYCEEGATTCPKCWSPSHFDYSMIHNIKYSDYDLHGNRNVIIIRCGFCKFEWAVKANDNEGE